MSTSSGSRVRRDGHDRDVVEPVGPPGLLSASDLYFHCAILETRRGRQRRASKGSIVRRQPSVSILAAASTTGPGGRRRNAAASADLGADLEPLGLDLVEQPLDPRAGRGCRRRSAASTRPRRRRRSAGSRPAGGRRSGPRRSRRGRRRRSRCASGPPAPRPGPDRAPGARLRAPARSSRPDTVMIASRGAQPGDLSDRVRAVVDVVELVPDELLGLELVRARRRRARRARRAAAARPRCRRSSSRRACGRSRIRPA